MAVLQKPVQCLGQAARFMKDKAKVLEGGGDGEDLTVHMPGASCWAMEDNNLCLGRADGQCHAVTEAMRSGLDSPGKTHGDDSLVPA